MTAEARSGSVKNTLQPATNTDAPPREAEVRWFHRNGFGPVNPDHRGGRSTFCGPPQRRR